MQKRRFSRNSLVVALVLQAAVGSAILSYPTKSEAMIGLAVAPPAAIVGGVILGIGTLGGAGLCAYGHSLDHGGLATLFSCLAGLVYGGLIDVVGLVVLSEEGTENLAVVFSPIEGEQAAGLGITNSQQIAWNTGLDDLNAIRETLELGVRENPLRTTEEVQAEWDVYRPELSPEVGQVLERIAAAASAQK